MSINTNTVNMYPEIIPSAPPEEWPYLAKEDNLPISDAPSYTEATSSSDKPSSPPSYSYAAIGERTSRLVEMSTEVANSILPKTAVNAEFVSGKVPDYVRPQKESNWFSWVPTVLNIDMSRREYNFFSTKTVVQEPPRIKSKEEIVEEKQNQENTKRKAIGGIGLAILLAALYQIGTTMRDNAALFTNIGEYKDHISSWNTDRNFYMHNDNVLINNIVGKVCAIYERQRVDGIFKFVCYILGAISGGSLLTGALYNAKEYYRVAVILGVIASSVGALRYGYRRNDPIDIRDAKFVQKQIKEYNRTSEK